jgi:hypothetical protein
MFTRFRALDKYDRGVLFDYETTYRIVHICKMIPSHAVYESYIDDDHGMSQSNTKMSLVLWHHQ